MPRTPDEHQAGANPPASGRSCRRPPSPSPRGHAARRQTPPPTTTPTPPPPPTIPPPAPATDAAAEEADPTDVGAQGAVTRRRLQTRRPAPLPPGAHLPERPSPLPTRSRVS